MWEFESEREARLWAAKGEEEEEERHRGDHASHAGGKGGSAGGAGLERTRAGCDDAWLSHLFLLHIR